MRQLPTAFVGKQASKNTGNKGSIGDGRKEELPASPQEATAFSTPQKRRYYYKRKPAGSSFKPQASPSPVSRGEEAGTFNSSSPNPKSQLHATTSNNLKNKKQARKTRRGPKIEPDNLPPEKHAAVHVPPKAPAQMTTPKTKPSQQGRSRFRGQNRRFSRASQRAQRAEKSPLSPSCNNNGGGGGRRLRQSRNRTPSRSPYQNNKAHPGKGRWNRSPAKLTSQSHELEQTQLGRREHRSRSLGSSPAKPRFFSSQKRSAQSTPRSMLWALHWITHRS